MSTALSNIQEQIKKELASMQDTAPPVTGQKISTKGRVFTFPDGRKTVDPIQTVILDYRNFNAYYKKGYVEGEVNGPDCFAISKTIEGLEPHEQVPEPMADRCEGCAMNKFGSAPTGKGKACRNTVRIAVTPPDADAETMPMLISASPKALKSWAAFLRNLEVVGLLPVQIVTEIAFDQNEAYPLLTFKPLQPHDNLELFWALREKAQALLDQPPIMDD